MLATIALLGGACFAVRPACGQDFEMTEQQFNSWVTNGSGQSMNLEDQLNSSLSLEIRQLDMLCNFSDSQRDKLELAGQADIAHFNRKVDVVRKRLVGKTFDGNDINGPWQEVQPLNQEWRQGIFGDASLFAKVLVGVMTDQQAQEFEQLKTVRWNRCYTAAAKVAIAGIESGVPMTSRQRQQLVEALSPPSRPKTDDTQYLQYLVLYEFSQLPTEDLEKIFDAAQLKALEHHRQQGRQWQGMLRHQGLLVEP